MKNPVSELVEGIQESIAVLARPDKIIGELLDIMRDTHRILLKLEPVVDRMDKIARQMEERLPDFDSSQERFGRLERAIFNIERATLGVEASLGALPRALRLRIDRGRRPGAGDAAPPEGPYPH